MALPCKINKINYRNNNNKNVKKEEEQKQRKKENDENEVESSSKVFGRTHKIITNKF